MRMRRICLWFIGLFCLCCVSFAQQNKVICKVVQYRDSVSVIFGDGIVYLGVDYAKKVELYDENEKIRFKSAFEVCSYLSSHWGWKPCGNPVISKDGKSKVYLMEHEVLFDVNLFRKIELFNKYKRSIKE